MKIFILFFILYLNLLQSLSYTTDASKFAEYEYEKQNCLPKVHINVKREHTVKNMQNFKGQDACIITFGYGDLKIKEKFCGKKKFYILYICLLDKNSIPFWSYVIQFK